MQIKRQSFAFSLASGTATTPSFEEVPLTEAELDDETSRRRPSLLNVPTIVTTKTVLRRLSSLVLPPENPPLGHCIIEDDDDTDGNCARSCSPLDNNSPPVSQGGVGLGEYVSVLVRHPSYRAYLASHLCQQLGDYFVRIANVLVVEEYASRDASGRALAHVTLARLLPIAVFALVGGFLADSLDRRKLMIATDCLSSIVVLGYLVAIRYESLPLVYGVTILRSALSATYYPSATGIIPDLVRGDHHDTMDEHASGNSSKEDSRLVRDVQLAVTLNSWAWGASVITGGLLAGKVASLFGLKACYLIDCATYITSALLIYKGVRPDYNKKVDNYGSDAVVDGGGESDGDEEEFRDEDVVPPSNNNNIEPSSLLGYLAACGFGWMIFSEPSASFVWGIEDIVGAQYATVFSVDGTEDTVLSSLHMGLLFSTVGLGCSIGPVLLNCITDARRPYTLQRACWISLVVLSFGWFLISFVETFPQFLMGTFIRTMGSGAAFVYSNVILQTLCDPRFLGRVLALTYTLTKLFEAASSFFAGTLSTSKGFSPDQLARVGSVLGLLVVIYWGVYYSLSLGAAHPKFNNNYDYCNNNKDNISESKDHYEMVPQIKKHVNNDRVESMGIEMGNEDLPNISIHSSDGAD